MPCGIADMFRPAPQDFERGRTVVAVDPPVTGHANSDACGIIVAARAGQWRSCWRTSRCVRRRRASGRGGR